MRELEREPSSDIPPCPPLAIVGRGRLGHALAEAIKEAGGRIQGPLGRDERPRGATAVLLCVPDREIESAARELEPGPLVGHCSGATGLEVLAPHEAFSLHPLMTVTDAGADFAGAGAAVAATTSRGLSFARRLAEMLAMHPVEVAAADRVLYHAAASVASNFLLTVEGAAEELASGAGLDRALLVPLVRATVENWAAHGAREALTGPVARGDELTVAAQRAAVGHRAPQLAGLFDALVEATRMLAEPAEQPA